MPQLTSFLKEKPNEDGQDGGKGESELVQCICDGKIDS